MSMNTNTVKFLFSVLILGTSTSFTEPVQRLERLQLVDSLKIADVWSGHPVDFAFVQHGDSQYVAYYDSNRKMSIAVRHVKSKNIHTVSLPSTIGWDSHNYISMAFDSLGILHVSGNMHSSPLVYFKSTVPGKVDSLKSAPMVGSLESSVTYPVFFHGPSHELLFMYRDGSSGNGNQIFNKWNAVSKKWTRLMDKALFDGQGQRNAYMGGPLLGPDGYYHVYWMWRETADASTTHDVGYLRSKDLINWENAAGTKVNIPVTLSTPNVLVEAIPQRGGVINRGAIGFDLQKRVIITYHKFDANGNTQLYNARYEGSQWKINQASKWNYRWDFGGIGSLVMEITFGPVMLEPSGFLTQQYSHIKSGTGIWQLDMSTLSSVMELGSSLWPQSHEQARQAGMVVHWLKSSGLISMAGTFLNSTSDTPKDPSTVYALRWETMPENKDQPRPTIPAPTPLMLYTFRDPNVATNADQKSKSVPVAENSIHIRNGKLIIGNTGARNLTVVISNLLGKTIAVKNIKELMTLDLRPYSRSGTVMVRVLSAGEPFYTGRFTY